MARLYPASQAEPLKFVTPKHPDDVRAPYSFQFKIETGESITNHSVTPASGITLVTTAIEDATVIAYLSGGTADTDYTVTFQITKNTGEVVNASTVVSVRNR